MIDENYQIKEYWNGIADVSWIIGMFVKINIDNKPQYLVQFIDYKDFPYIREYDINFIIGVVSGNINPVLEGSTLIFRLEDCYKDLWDDLESNRLNILTTCKIKKGQ